MTHSKIHRAASTRVRISYITAGAVLAWLATASCFRPGISDGQFSCGADELCPPGFACNADGVCVQDPDVIVDAGGGDGNGNDDGGAGGIGDRVAGTLLFYDFAEAAGAAIIDTSDGFPESEPFNLAIRDPVTLLPDPGLVQRVPGAIELSAPVRISAEVIPRKLFDELIASQAFTIEAWVTPSVAAVSGPRRIVSLSADNGFQHLALVHGGPTPEVNSIEDLYALRLRTSMLQNENGKPEFETALGTARAALTHVVYTRGQNGDVRGYLDGRVVVLREHVLPGHDGPVLDARTGDFSVWTETEPDAADAIYQISIGNELAPGAERAFQGQIHLVAVYARALDEDEVVRNFDAGPDPELGP